MDSLIQALTAVQNVLAHQSDTPGNLEHSDPLNKQSDLNIDHDKLVNVGRNEVVIAGESETSIYHNAVEQHEPGLVQEIAKVRQSIDNVNLGKRNSSSSEDAVDTSDGLMEIDNVFAGAPAGVAGPSALPQQPNPERPTVQMAVEPGGTAMTVADRMIREADSTKSRMVVAKGTYGTAFQDFLKTAYVDEQYMVMGSHLDENICKKIINHEYVDFAKLLPRDRVGLEEDQCMELVTGLLW